MVLAISRDVMFDTGLAARRRGIPRGKCPYPEGMHHARRWLEGWDSAAPAPVAGSASAPGDPVWPIALPAVLDSVEAERVAALAGRGASALAISRALRRPIADTVAHLQAAGLADRPVVCVAAGTPWEEDEKIWLERQWMAGIPVREISHSLGRRESAVASRLEKMLHRPWSYQERQELRRLFDQGLAEPELAARINRTTAAIRTQLVLMGRSLTRAG